MKNILIVEDENIAAQHLQRLVAELLPDAHILATLQSIEESIEYLQQQPHPDLILLDIHLADGLSFHIFDHVQPHCPIIFTTAYDQYALQAFKVNSIDYLLKPINRDDLQHALDKLHTLASPTSSQLAALAGSLHHYRTHFLVPMRDKLIPVPIDQIACLYLEDKITRAILLDGHHQIIDRPLDNIMEQLDPSRFFRANRQYIVSHAAISEISVWPISKLALTLTVETPDRIIIPKARVAEFKQWFSGEE